MSTLPITVIILSSEEHAKLNLARKSVDWADEVLVIKEEKMITDFAQVRNTAAARAKHEVLFFLDSDEVVETNAEAKVSALIERSDWNGASILRRDVFLGKEMRHGEVGHVEINRIFRKGHFHFERPVHEIGVVEGRVIDSEIVVYHAAHDSISTFLTKVLGYMQLEFEMRKKKKEHVSAISLFAWPTGKFLSNYFLKLGLLDGWQGLIYAVVMSIHSFGLRAQLYETEHQT